MNTQRFLIALTVVNVATLEVAALAHASLTMTRYW